MHPNSVRIWTPVLGLFLSLGLAGIGFTRTAKSSANDDVIDELDRVIQKRFHDVVGFGMARMGTERGFDPSTAEEKAAVKNLEKAGYSVTLFLAGRNILQDIPDSFRYNRARLGSSSDHLISGPITVNSQQLKGIPDARDIWKPARETLRQFDNGETRYAFAQNGWDVEARPVKAFDDSCLKCHAHHSLVVNKDGTVTINMAAEDNGLRVGDTLGAMLYVYKKMN